MLERGFECANGGLTEIMGERMAEMAVQTGMSCAWACSKKAHLSSNAYPVSAEPRTTLA